MMRWVKYWGTVAVLCGLLCSAVNGCPHKCSCSGSHVDCQGQGFRTGPGNPAECRETVSTPIIEFLENQ